MEVRFEPWMTALLRSEPVARLGTVAADGRPHLVPVCFALLAPTTVVVAVDEKPKVTTEIARLRNIQRDPRVTLLVDHYEGDWERLAWVRVEGTARVEGRGEAYPLALAALRERYPQYGPMALESLPLIVIAVERAVGWRWNRDA